MAKIYLAARYSRREEMLPIRERLQAMGHTVTSRWLDGSHQIDRSGQPIGDHGEKLVEEGNDARAAQLRSRFADEDYRDVLACDILVHFTEEPRKPHTNRGGRHVEMGLALGLMKRVHIVGWRENIFCWHEDVRFFDTIDEWLALIEESTIPVASTTD